MNAPVTDKLFQECLDIAQNAKRASVELGLVSSLTKDAWLNESARLLRSEVEAIVASNAIDLENAPAYGLSSAAIDRLRLDEPRIIAIAEGLEQVARLADPVGEIIDGSVRPNGLEIKKIRVPLGVVFFIYESRPNVTADAAAICIKSGNAVILRGGKEALHSSAAIVRCLKKAAKKVGIPEHAVQFLETTDRQAVGYFLGMSAYIDVAIPRGGESLIRRVAEEATMPVIKHFDGNCHLFIDEDADIEMAIRLIENSKCQRMGVCNALESLLVHSKVAKQLLPTLETALNKFTIEFRGCDTTRAILKSAIAADESDWSKEYLGPILSIKVVESVDEAISHINHYGSHHTDGIVTRNLENARRFAAAVDSAAVMINASTRFNDGGEFGFGAEIGISTDKFHARGPCGLRELTSYKYIVTGTGQVRN